MLATRSANCWDPPETFCHLLNFPWCCVGALTSQGGFSKDSSGADYLCFDAKETRSRALEMQKNSTSQACFDDVPVLLCREKGEAGRFKESPVAGRTNVTQILI